MIGTTEINLVKGNGEFLCPNCRQRRKYQRRGVRRFLTLYLIPLIPLDEVSEHLRCLHCKQQFSVSVLSLRPEDLPPPRTPDQARNMLLAALRLVFLAPRPSAAILGEYREFARALSNIVATDEELWRMRDWVIGPERPRTRDWVAAAGRLANGERDQLAQSLFMIASADGELTPEQAEELAELPPVLHLKENQFRKLVAQVVLAEDA